MTAIIINTRQLFSPAMTFSQQIYEYNYLRVWFECQIISDCMQTKIIRAC